MKKLLSLIIFGISLISCAKQIKKEDIIQQENIQKVTNIYKDIKTYDYNPNYKLHISVAANFTYEILVNDLPTYAHYTSGNTTGSVDINQSILHSGKQKLKIRMTPKVDKQGNMAKEIDFSNLALKLSIEYGDHNVEKYADFTSVLEYEMPIRDEKLPFYEFELEFDAPQVPYENQIQHWQNSVDLSKEDSEKLQEEVENFYREMIDLYKNRDVNALAGKYYNKLVSTGTYYYNNEPEYYEYMLEEWIYDANNSEGLILENYTMKLYGDGKLVRLTNNDAYGYFYSDSALVNQRSKAGPIVEFTMFLHRPALGAPLEIIR